MKKKSYSIAITFALTILTLGCGPQPTNTTRNTTDSENNNNTSVSGPASEAAVAPCDIANVQKTIDGEITLDPVLDYQRTQGKFRITVEKHPRLFIVVRINGKVVGNEKQKHLSKIL